MIVLDASAAVEALLGNAEAAEVIASETTYSPHLVDAEVAHALRGLALGDALDAAQARRLLRTWRSLGVVRFAIHPLLDRVWALRARLSAYDATYVALAEELGCRLLTADARLARSGVGGCEITVLT